MDGRPTDRPAPPVHSDATRGNSWRGSSFPTRPRNLINGWTTNGPACTASALGCYKGKFLEGFFIPDAAAEFDQWMDDQRTGLHRQCTRMLQGEIPGGVLHSRRGRGI